MQLRPYQQKTIDQIYDYLRLEDGNPCVVLPTGAGKSVVIGFFVKTAVQDWPQTKILMLVHSRELIQQNFDKLVKLWPNAPVAIYSAGLGSKQTDSITYAGIQSIHKKADILGHIDLVLADECHLISHQETGMYRNLLSNLKSINPLMRVVGFTATPFRLGHGKITDGEAIFDDLIEPVTIEELQSQGYLSLLRSKVTNEKLSVQGVHKRGGEYIESELQKAVDKEDLNSAIVEEIITYAEDRKHWLIFCTGVNHAYNIRDQFLSRLISAATITGATPLEERDELLRKFKAGEIKVLTNCDILATGFDFPDIDLIAMLRPTMSPVLYVQQAGRGLRVKSHTDHCLILDFAGVVAQHGPITMVQAPVKNGSGDGVAPIKYCDKCREILYAGVRVCTNCGYEFPPPEKDPLYLRDDDIQGNGIIETRVFDWDWRLTESKKGNKMVVVSYYTGVGERINEYLLLWTPGFPGKKAMDILEDIAKNCGIGFIPPQFERMKEGNPPYKIRYKMEGKYPRIIEKIWFDENEIIPF